MQSKEEKQGCIEEALGKAGMSIEKFMQFLEAIRRMLSLYSIANGNNLDVWNIEELKESINKFIILQQSSFAATAHTTGGTGRSPISVSSRDS